MAALAGYCAVPLLRRQPAWLLRLGAAPCLRSDPRWALTGRRCVPRRLLAGGIPRSASRNVEPALLHLLSVSSDRGRLGPAIGTAPSAQRS